jgi:hypothetical protein
MSFLCGVNDHCAQGSVLMRGYQASDSFHYVDASPGEAEDPAVFDAEHPARVEVDAVGTARDAVDPKVANDDDVVAPALTLIRALHSQNRGDLAAAAVKRDRLRDGHRAEAAGVECVDLAARRGLGNRARPGLARRRATARVGVVTPRRTPRYASPNACAGVPSRRGVSIAPRTVSESASDFIRIADDKSSK